MCVSFAPPPPPPPPPSLPLLPPAPPFFDCRPFNVRISVSLARRFASFRSELLKRRLNEFDQLEFYYTHVPLTGDIAVGYLACYKIR